MQTADPVTFHGAQVLGEDGLHQRPLAIGSGVIAAPGARGPDLGGFILLPGIIDLHGDGFERHLAPRRGALDSLGAGLVSVDAELAASGITTAVLAQFFSWEGGMRGPDFAEAMAEALATTILQTETHLQLRMEISMVAEFPRAVALIERHDIRYVVLNDHLPHAELSAGKRPPRLTGQALKAGRSPEAHLAMLQGLHDGMDVGALAEFVDALVAEGVLLGSHDDRRAEDRARYRDLGVRIAEFPETVEAARAAKLHGDPVLMGAPNVVRGASHDGRVSAGDLVAEGLVDALVSDYHYPSLARAAMKLAPSMGLAAAWGLISTGPARVMSWTDRGVLAEGMRADLTIWNAEAARIEGTMVAGRWSYLSGALAARLTGSGA